MPDPLPQADGAGSPASPDCQSVTILGDPALLEQPLLALVCSRRLPPRLVLPAYDLACALRDAGRPVCGGFQTPVERDCLGFLLAGAQPVVVCPARGVAGMRLPAPWRAAVRAGRLAVASPFPPGQRRATGALADARNDWLAALCAGAISVHAAPGGGTERFCRAVLAAGQPLWTLDDPANAALLALGAETW